MEIQSGSIEAREVRNREIEEHLRDFCKEMDDNYIIKVCGASFDIFGISKNINNETATGSAGAATSGICTIVDSNTRDTQILIPIENTVQYPVTDKKDRGQKDKKEEKEKDGIGE